MLKITKFTIENLKINTSTPHDTFVGGHVWVDLLDDDEKSGVVLSWVKNAGSGHYTIELDSLLSEEVDENLYKVLLDEAGEICNEVNERVKESLG